MSLRFSHRVVLLTLLTVPLLIWAAATVQTNTDDVRIWLPDSTPQRESYDRFAELFGSDSEIIFSWEGSSPDDPRLHELVQKLNDANQLSGNFDTIFSGASIINEMSGEKFSYGEEAMKRRLAGVFYSETDDSCSVVARLSESGRRNGKRCVAAIYRGADDTAGLTAADLKLGGDVFTNAKIDEQTNRALLLAFPAILLATLITWLCLRSVQLVVTTLFVAGYSALVSIAIVSLLGLKVNGMLVIMPILILVLSLSTAVHFCSYYISAIRESHPEPINRMLQLGRRPSFLAIVTTAIGVAMLAVSHVPAVRTFAICSAMGLLVSLVSVLVIFPCLLKLWPPKLGISKSSPEAEFLGERAFASKALASPLTWVSIAVLPLLLIGVARLQTTLDPENMFQADHVVNSHRDWLAERFTSINAIDLIATFPEDAEGGDLLNQIRQLRTMQKAVTEIPAVTSTFSIANVCRIPRSGVRSAKTIFQESVINDAIRGNRDSLRQHRLLAIKPDSVSWRIRVALECGGAEHQAVCQRIETVANAATTNMPNPPETWATGIWLMTSCGRSQILLDLATSFVMAFFIITPIVMLLLRGIVVGLLAMIPNVLPALAFFGTLGWLGVEVDIGTLLTASVGLGIAVDDTLHFLHVFRRELKDHNRHEATLRTMRHCWRPMLFTSLICAAGLSIFVMSSFVPARQFSIAIVVLLCSAAICDLVVLPALILSPLGHYFEAMKSRQQTVTVSLEEELPAAASVTTRRPAVETTTGV